MEHAELVAEMAHVEHLTTQERLHLARMRRIQQLKVWKQRDKEWRQQNAKKERAASTKPHIFFSDSVMLLEAAARNDIAEVRRLLMKGVTPDATNEDGLTALHQCCIDNNEEMLRLLLEYGADVNAQDSEKWTPLHAAATCGHLHLVRFLISKGANLLAVNADGNMPYDICEDETALDHIEGEMARRGVTQELIDETRAATETLMLCDLQATVAAGKMADLELPDHHGATPLHIASANGYIRVVGFLLDQHVSTDPKDNDLWQPVHAAACWGHLEVLELLVQNGADLNAKNKHEETPADICEDPELRERIKQLHMEQESKRLQDAQIRRVRRSQSNNTRTQSVRRTSIRDKELTTKKDAVEEAKLRKQAQEGYAPALGENNNGVVKSVDTPDTTIAPAQQSPDSTTSPIIGTSNFTTNTQYPNPKYSVIPPLGVNNNPLYSSNLTQYPNLPAKTPTFAYPNSVASSPSKDVNVINGGNFGTRRDPEGKDNDCYTPEVTDIGGVVSREAVEVPAETFSTTDNNGKINVHVTVMINSGTLADLKKQRAQTRHAGSDLTGLSPVSSINTSLDNSTATGATGHNNIVGVVPRFSGNTGEVVGDTRSHRCCVIM